MPRPRRRLVHQGVELACGWEFEDEARAQGHLVVAGVDEVGRGALCGPVVAAAVVLPREFDATGIDDSKRLTRRQRERQVEGIRSGAVAWALGSADPEEIDRLNILRATHLAIRRAVEALDRLPDLILLDGRPVPDLPVPHRAIVKGDARSVSIAAASILAKVARDEAMLACDRRYPGYGLGHNMGYASRDHLDALQRLGPSAIHRRSFEPSRQPRLF